MKREERKKLKIKITPSMKERIEKELSTQKKITKKQFAKDIGINDKYFSQILNGKKEIDRALFEVIAGGLGVRAEYLLRNDDFRTDYDLIQSIDNATQNMSFAGYEETATFLETLGVKCEWITYESIDEDIRNNDGVISCINHNDNPITAHELPDMEEPFRKKAVAQNSVYMKISLLKEMRAAYIPVEDAIYLFQSFSECSKNTFHNLLICLLKWDLFLWS